jgi:hypothetical protein
MRWRWLAAAGTMRLKGTEMRARLTNNSLNDLGYTIITFGGFRTLPASSPTEAGVRGYFGVQRFDKDRSKPQHCTFRDRPRET